MNELEFGAYLKALRKNNNLTIRQLEEKSGVSNAYLSQLENGKRGLPSPDIVKKIHEPLGVPYDELMEKAGYISSETRSELLPETVKTLEEHRNLEELISNVANLFIESITTENGEIDPEFLQIMVQIEKELNPDYTQEEITEALSSYNVNLDKWFEYLTFEEKIWFLNIIIKDFAKRGIDTEKLFKSGSANYIPILKVPVMGYIAAGQPILAEEHIEEWTEIPNNWHLKEGEAIILRVKGDSMIGSRIFDGDKVVVKLQQDVESGEIAAVNVNGYEATLKRVKKTENGQVILYPDNPNYEPIFIENEGARIIGKVIQVMFEPK